MLADAYKIASDIKNVMADLRFDANTIPTSSGVASFRLEIKSSLPPLKHRLSSITQRLNNFIKRDLTKFSRSHASLSLDCMTVYDYISDMVKYVNVMIDNADVYTSDGYSPLWRYTPPVQTSSYVMAHYDIADIAKTAIECIDIIGKLVIPK